MVKQNLGQMANDAEKAKAYNKLVDLAMKQFNDQQSIQQTNQIMKKNDPVDEAAMSEGAYNALIKATSTTSFLTLSVRLLLSLTTTLAVYGVLVFSSLMRVRLQLRTVRLMRY